MKEKRTEAAVCDAVDVITEAITHYYITKKVKIAWDGCYAYCPSCGNEDIRGRELHKFCHECGQRLGELE